MAFKNYSTNEKKNEFNYEVIEKLGKLSSNAKTSKELRLVSWNGDIKYDLRSWITNEDGTEKCGKGVTLSSEELQSLYEILKEMDEESEDE